MKVKVAEYGTKLMIRVGNQVGLATVKDVREALSNKTIDKVECLKDAPATLLADFEIKHVADGSVMLEVNI